MSFARLPGYAAAKTVYDYSVWGVIADRLIRWMRQGFETDNECIAIIRG